MPIATSHLNPVVVGAWPISESVCHACRVQRQVWEFDKNLLQQDALPPVGQYKYEVATIMRAMAMDEFLPAVIAGPDTPEEAEPQQKAPLKGPQKGAAGAALRALALTARGPTAAAAAGWPSVGITRKILRKGSRVLQVRLRAHHTQPSRPEPGGEIIHLHTSGCSCGILLHSILPSHTFTHFRCSRAWSAPLRRSTTRSSNCASSSTGTARLSTSVPR